MNDHKLAQTHAHAHKFSRAVARSTRGRLKSAEKDVQWVGAALGTTSRRARRLWYGRTSWTVSELAQVSDRAGFDLQEVFGTASRVTAA